MFARRPRDTQISQGLINEESQFQEDDDKRSTFCFGSERDIKRTLILGIFMSIFILFWILLQPTPQTTQIFVWTEQNTKYPKIESTIPPSDQFVLLQRLSFNPTLINLIDNEWIDIMENSPIIGIDFEFNKGFSEKFRVVFESGHVAVVSAIN